MDSREGESHAFVQQAEALLERGRPKEALQALETALGQFPEEARLHAFRALALRRLGKDIDGLASLQRALHLDPSNEWFYRLLSHFRLWSSSGQNHKLALEAAREALRLAPESAAALLTLFNVEVAMDMKHLADRTALRLLSLAPELPEAHQALGRLALEREQFLLARRHFQKARALSPSDPEAHYWGGWVEMRAGRAERALEAFQTALSIEPGEKRFQKAVGTAGVEIAASRYGRVSTQPYELPVPFSKRTLVGKNARPHLSRQRQRFNDFTLKFVTERHTPIPFISGLVHSVDFRLKSAEGERILRSWTDNLGFSANGKYFVLELRECEFFGDLGSHQMVIHSRIAPLPETGHWVLFLSQELSEEAIAAMLGGVTPERTPRGWRVAAEEEWFEVLAPRQDTLTALSADEETVIKNAEVLLEDRVRTVLFCVFGGQSLAQKVLTHLSTQTAVVAIDVRAEEVLRGIPPLVLHGTVAPAVQTKGLRNSWEEALRKPPEGTRLWTLLFDDVLQPDVWLSFVRQAGGELTTPSDYQTRLRIQAHELTSQPVYDRPNLLTAPAFERLTGKPLKCQWRWQFNSSQLALAVASAVHERWPCVIYDWNRRQFFKVEELRLGEDARGSSVFQGAAFGVDDVPRTDPSPQEQIYELDVALATSPTAADWNDFVRARAGWQRPPHDPQLLVDADWYVGYRFLSARHDPLSFENWNRQKEFQVKTAIVLGSPAATLFAFYGNDRGMLLDTVRAMHSRWPGALLLKNPYGSVAPVADAENVL